MAQTPNAQNAQTAQNAQAELKRKGCDDATCAKLAGLPNINWTALLAIFDKLIAAGVSLTDILAALGL